MSRIDELIGDLCPDGVEFKTLGEVGTFIRGNGLQKSDLTNVGFPAIHYGQVHTFYEIWTTETISFVAPEFAKRLRQAEPGNLVIATTSEDNEAVGKAIAWLGKSSAAVSGDAYIFRHSMDPKFVAYFFNTDSFQAQKTRGITGTKVKRISSESLAKIRLPVPPLEVQHEIVQVLDTFTALEAELEARRRQYQHYRDAALQFDDRVQYESLRDLGQWYGGGTPSKTRKGFWEGGTIPWLSPKDMRTPIAEATEDYITPAAVAGSATKLVPANSVAIVVRSSILDRVLPTALVPVEITLNQDMKALVPKDGVLPGYIAHLMRSLGPALLRVARKTGGSVASIEVPKLMAFKVPVPPVEQQETIVSVLDKLDALVNDLSIGLPAELKARRQQYEHYRDRLLTFRERPV